MDGHEAPPRPRKEGSGRSPEALAREHRHYEAHERYLLHFLELDQTPFRRWLIRQVLRTWDRQMAFLPPTLFRGKSVLEVGCGNPRLLYYVKALGAKEAIGCDLSERFVATGLGRKVAHAWTRTIACDGVDLRFIYDDVNGPALDGICVNVVTCFQSLHHLDLSAFAETCRRVTSPDGVVIISDPVGDHPVRRLGNIVGQRIGLLSPDEKALSPDAVIETFLRHGFRLVEFRTMNPTLEVFFHLTEIPANISGIVRLYLKIPLAFLRPLENLLEFSLLRVFPRLGWRFLAIFKKA